jgi:hypothetical protein
MALYEIRVSTMLEGTKKGQKASVRFHGKPGSPEFIADYAAGKADPRSARWHIQWS